MRNGKGVSLAIIIALVGCGAPPPGFAGAWTGTATQSALTCTDGSKLTPQPPGPFGAQITETGTKVSFPIVCGATLTFNAGVSGTDATQQGTATCPTKTQNGSIFVGTISNGTLSLSDDVLRVSLDERTDISGALTGSCMDTVSGTLTRKP
jgi:hypothetical protein